MDSINDYVYERIVILKRGVKINLKDRFLLKEDLGLDSIKIVSLLTTVCDKFNIDLMELSDYDLINIKKVEDVCNLIKTKKK